MKIFSVEISRPATTNIFTDFTNFTVKYYKYGKIVTLMLNIAGNFKASGYFVTLLDIPKGYYPINTLTQNYITQSGDAMGISIRAAGDIQLYNGNKDVTGWYCRQVLTYITN